MPPVASLTFVRDDRLLAVVWKNGALGFLDLDAGGTLCSMLVRNEVAKGPTRKTSSSPMRQILDKVRSRSKSPVTKVVKAKTEAHELSYSKKLLNPWEEEKSKKHYSMAVSGDLLLLSNGSEVRVFYARGEQ